MFPKCEARPYRIELDMFYFRNPFPPFFARTLNSLGVQRVGKGALLSQESQSSSNIVRMDGCMSCESVMDSNDFSP